MSKIKDKFEKHYTKSGFYVINNVRGITLTTLVITIIVLLILASVATFTGIEAIENTKRTKFIAELKIMQSYVNQWYEDCKPSVNATEYDKQFATNVQTKFTIDGNVAVNATSSEPLVSDKVAQAQSSLNNANVEPKYHGNFYILEESQLQALGVEGVSQSVLVSVQDRKVVSYLGLKYKNQMYYTIDSIDGENGIDAIYNVGYENPNKNPPSILVTGRSVYNGETAKGAKYKFIVDVTQGSRYINKGDLYYGKIENGNVGSWNKTEDKSFIVDREGTYKIYYKDAAGNESEQVEYKIEPKATLLAGPNLNQKIKTIAGDTSATYDTENTSIIEIKTALEKPDNSILTDNNKISADNSQYPVYSWFNNGTIWVWSEENWFKLQADCGYLFRKFKNTKTIEPLYMFYTPNVSSMHAMFYGCTNLEKLNLSSFDTKNVNSMSHMFNGCNSLADLDLSGFDTRNTTAMNDMFSGCTKLTNLNVSNFDTAKVNNMTYMFYSCKALTNLNLSSFNTSIVSNMLGMFMECTNLVNLNLTNFDTNKVENMQYMFYNCNRLASLDLSSFNTQKVKTMNAMFYNCKTLTNLDLSSFNTESVITMVNMFHACSSLTNLNISSFNTSNVTNMQAMFARCSNLTNLNLSKFDTNKVTTMSSMFNSCNKLTELDLSNFNTENVTTMNNMFYGCSGLTSLDLSSFDTSKVTTMWCMFYGCNNLQTIYALDNFVTTALTNAPIANQAEGNTNSSHLFVNCTKLVGGAGTTYNSSNTDKTYARIDDPTNGKPGYFTRKQNV
ncbi:MAG: BspA family leucine-rich repeat surface protein [Clostridia bacterium]|nr:BspA family leucine-rich repeat surface protein [Clostridia bacterium]